MTDEWLRGFGPSLVARFVPQRPPFSFVSGVERFRWDGTPSIRAHHHVSPSDPVLAGHFPTLPMWPGALTIEGLGQTMQLLAALRTVRDRAQAVGIEPAVLHAGLLALDARAHLRPAHVPADVAQLLVTLAAEPMPAGVASRVNVRFLEPVFPGQRIDYEVTLRSEAMGVLQYEARASVGGVPVVEGTMSGSINRVLL